MTIREEQPAGTPRNARTMACLATGVILGVLTVISVAVVALSAGLGHPGDGLGILVFPLIVGLLALLNVVLVFDAHTTRGAWQRSTPLLVLGAPCLPLLVTMVTGLLQ